MRITNSDTKLTKALIIIEQLIIITVYGGSSWTTATPLNYTDISAPPAWCSFYGVTCGTNSAGAEYRRVIEIILKFQNFLGGTLPEFIHLGEMTKLDIYYSSISGTIPQSISKLSKLETLALHGNKIAGTIPDTLGSLSKVKSLLLGENQLSGTIPSSFMGLAGIERVDLTRMKLTGSIPSGLGKLYNLQDLHLDHNQLTGTIPLLNQPSLLYIWLNDNYLTMGSLTQVPPSTFSNTAQYQGYVYVMNNCLTFRHPYASYLNAYPTNCRPGEQTSKKSLNINTGKP